MDVTCRAGQNRMCAPCMTVYLVISLPETLYIHQYMYINNIYFFMCVYIYVYIYDSGQPS